mgnify:CR=1 FL=1
MRRLHASETMGGANEICSDKTGTLTQNRMTVQALYMGDQTMNGDTNPALAHDTNNIVLAQSVIFNSSARVETEQNGSKVVKGNVTEAGLIKYLLASKLDVEGYAEDKEQEGFVQFCIPFNSMRKRQTTAVKLASGKVRVFCKGGPEILMDLCTRKLD